jgi:hypothetical protein
VGKTTLLKGIRKRLTEIMLAELKKYPERVPVVIAQLVAPTSGSFNWGDYFKRLLIELSEPLVDHKLDMRKWDWTRLKDPNDGQDNLQLLLEGKPSSNRMRLASGLCITVNRRSCCLMMLNISGPLHRGENYLIS